MLLATVSSYRVHFTRPFTIRYGIFYLPLLVVFSSRALRPFLERLQHAVHVSFVTRWGALNFSYANRHHDYLLDLLGRRLTQQILVVQRINYSDGLPVQRHLLARKPPPMSTS